MVTHYLFFLILIRLNDVIAVRIIATNINENENPSKPLKALRYPANLTSLNAQPIIEINAITTISNTMFDIKVFQLNFWFTLIGLSEIIFVELMNTW